MGVKSRKPHSQETKNKIGLANKGKIRTDELKRQWSLAKKGIKHSVETRLKMSLAHKARREKNHLWRGG